MNPALPLRRGLHHSLAPAWLALLIASPARAHASFLHSDALDSLANAISWVVLIIAPVIGIVAFWLVHILPEKIAEKKKHPQAGAIQCLCLLSLCFGGLLWPLAWLWAYTRPVFYRTAYGTDIDHTHGAPNEAAKDKQPTGDKA